MLNTNQTEPITAEQLAADDARIPAQNIPKVNGQGQLTGFYRERVVAVDEQGRILGFVKGWRAPFTEPGFINSTLVVDRAARGQGVGATLADHLINWAVGLGAALVQSEMRDDLPEARTFAEKRGFVVDKHYFQSTLDVAAFDWAPYAGLVEDVEAAGIRFTTLAERGGEGTEQALYALVKETYLNVPWNEERSFLPFAEWRRWSLEPSKPEEVLLAYDGDRLVGTAILVFNQQSRGLYNEYTGVDRAYRGRRIAMALKLLAVRMAERYQAAYLRTDNDAHNEPMLGINRKLGYVAAPGHYRVRRQLL